MNPEININDYTYDLPESRIAIHPLAQRDQSKLLVYSHGNILHKTFTDLPNLLPENAVIFFNDTRVIPARLLFKKSTGAAIEIFLLNPVDPANVQLAMQTTHAISWTCMIGNLKRWPKNVLLQKQHGAFTLNAELLNREENIVRLSWEPASASFAEIVSQAGVTPLPPYIRRKPEPQDRTSYQTVYSHYDGAVAAPTAGLHFTEHVLAEIARKRITTDFLTLHVSAATFQPVKTERAAEHPMHCEQVTVSRENIENAISKESIVAVGTTSMRTLESLYWFGVKLMKDPAAEFKVDKMDPYHTYPSLPSKEKALDAILNKMILENNESITGETSIYILPGYTFRVCNALITNFHQPRSTLMLLVAAFVGSDWRKIYDQALNNNYRFLSYGDSSLLLP